MTTTLCLAENGDILTDTNSAGCTTVTLATGAYQVAQSAAVNVSLNRGQAWYAPGRGVDYRGLFYNCTLPDGQMANARREAIRAALLDTPGIAGFDPGEDITFERRGDTLRPVIPRLRVDCENSFLSAKIGAFT